MRVGSWKNWCLLEEKSTASNLTSKKKEGVVNNIKIGIMSARANHHSHTQSREDNVARRETMIIPFPGCWLVVIHPTRQELAIMN